MCTTHRAVNSDRQEASSPAPDAKTCLVCSLAFAHLLDQARPTQDHTLP